MGPAREEHVRGEAGSALVRRSGPRSRGRAIGVGPEFEGFGREVRMVVKAGGDGEEVLGRLAEIRVSETEGVLQEV